MSKMKLFQALLFVALLIGIFISMINGYHQCEEIGGDYVRGFIWLECINIQK